ncbi:hypothetical protein [Enterobacter roggenkampii]|uniref:hypothetical protein n=1 Tax=Enterobacter roggenkampii TaxID=1812935 RepID=UPI00069C683B|nr:hypothetical protein [Enterobacter roggenkampii]
MKQKFIEWFTKNNNGCSPAMEDDRSFVYEMTQHMFEAYQAGVAEGEARCAALAAENAGLKSACERVSMWNDFPHVTLRSTGEVVPYAVAYGSNGARDYMRNIAASAVLKDTPATGAFLAEVRASAIDSLVDIKTKQLADMHPDTHAFGATAMSIRSQINELQMFAAQLRKGVQS